MGENESVRAWHGSERRNIKMMTAAASIRSTVVLGDSYLAAKCFLAETVESFEEGGGVHYGVKTAQPPFLNPAQRP